MHTSMKVMMLDTVTDMKKNQILMFCLSLFLPTLSHTVELIL